MTTKTYRLSSHRMERKWHVLDASGVSLGRLAAEAAKLLLGKHKPDYEPHLPMGDFVVVVNAKRIRVTGDKTNKKIYYRHSGYPGSLRSRTLGEQLARDPRRVLETAVRGMLPRNARGRELFRHLNVYAGPEHPHGAQVTAGTGARAKQRVAQAAASTTARASRTAAAPVAVAPAPSADARPLAKWLRTELDEEARRLGITVEAKWKKADVIAAIEAREAAAGRGR